MKNPAGRADSRQRYISSQRQSLQGFVRTTDSSGVGGMPLPRVIECASIGREITSNYRTVVEWGGLSGAHRSPAGIFLWEKLAIQVILKSTR